LVLVSGLVLVTELVSELVLVSGLVLVTELVSEWVLELVKLCMWQ
jgi:hypothetical protein